MAKLAQVLVKYTLLNSALHSRYSSRLCENVAGKFASLFQFYLIIYRYPYKQAVKSLQNRMRLCFYQCLWKTNHFSHTFKNSTHTYPCKLFTKYKENKLVIWRVVNKMNLFRGSEFKANPAVKTEKYNL